MFLLSLSLSLQATPEKLLEYLIEENVDDNFHSDFLLTYRSFLDSIDPIVAIIKQTWTKGLPDQRDRVSGHGWGHG